MVSTQAHAEAQREAVEEARRRVVIADDDGRVHVMGPKLYGPVLMRERECSNEAPFVAASMPEVVVFHPLARPMSGVAGYFCPACGERNTGGVLPAEA